MIITPALVAIALSSVADADSLELPLGSGEGAVPFARSPVQFDEPLLDDSLPALHVPRDGGELAIEISGRIALGVGVARETSWLVLIRLVVAPPWPWRVPSHRPSSTEEAERIDRCSALARAATVDRAPELEIAARLLALGCEEPRAEELGS